VTNRLFRALMPAIVGLLAVLLLLSIHPTGRDSSVRNMGWNGLSRAADALHAAPLHSFADAASLPESGTLIVIPRLRPSEADLEVMDGFTSSGGTLVILDDFAFGNDVLSHLGVDIRFNGGTLMDPLYCHRNAAIPRVELTAAGLATGEGSIVLDHATWLDGAVGEQVWAWSSYFSYGDTNGDGGRDSGEPVGPLPVAATAPHGRGRVVVVADSSMLLNGVVGLGDNVRALEPLLQGEVRIDQVHLPEAGMDRGQGVLDSVRATFGADAGALALALLASCLAVGYAWYNRGRYEYD